MTDELGNVNVSIKPRAKVFVALGGTKSLGDYNNVKFDFSLSLDTVDASTETIQAEFQRASDLVRSEFNKCIEQLKKKDGGSHD